MKVLAIETSCDETAIAILECEGPSTLLRTSDEKSARFRVLGNALLSQIEIHRQYGGVFPALAKREHAKNLVPILEAALEEAELLHEDIQVLSQETHDTITVLLEREPGLSGALLAFLAESEPPVIDAVAVTAGPGLEPALWVGINFAKALALAWDKPLVAVNHMEGHILAGLAKEALPLPTGAPNEPVSAASSGTRSNLVITGVEMPVLALLISGGHTELVLMKEWLQYKMVGQTRDDAVGEAFDKVARMLGLPYPGGPEISKLAEECRASDVLHSEIGHRMSNIRLPRPMINDDTCDFSFAGLKTATRYMLADLPQLGEKEKSAIAQEFEDAVTDVLWKKTARALEETGAQTLVIGGGVSANIHIRRVFTENVDTKCPHVELRIPSGALTTDNAIMIALAGYYRALQKDFADPATLCANGNLHLAKAPDQMQ